MERARRYTDDVEFSAEDATRTELSFLCKVAEVAVNAGATTVNIPDTVGYTHPREVAEIFRTLRRNVPGLEGVVLSAHCHNDLGLATANSLAAVEAGARQVECTVNGIGERAGNAALEEVVMTILVRRDLFDLTTGIHTHRIHPTSRILTQITGIHPQPNKAIVGRNAFAHEAGIHQDGMLKERSTYEIMDPVMVGVPGSQLILGKHSGRHALKARFQDLGFDLDDEAMERAYRLFKLLADQKKDILDEDLLSIVHHGAMKDIPITFWLEKMTGKFGGEVVPRHSHFEEEGRGKDRGGRKGRRTNRRGIRGGQRGSGMGGGAGGLCDPSCDARKRCGGGGHSEGPSPWEDLHRPRRLH